jgi:drug/metabolite transporter (DMT)-like permease
MMSRGDGRSRGEEMAAEHCLSTNAARAGDDRRQATHALRDVSARTGGASGLRYAKLGAVVACILWGGNFQVVRTGAENMPPAAFASGRLLIAGVTALAYLALKGRASPLWRREHWRFLVLGAFIGVAQVLLTFSLIRTNVGTAALILASVPVWSSLVAIAARTDKGTLRAFLGMGVALSGIGLIVGTGQGNATGDLLSVGSALSVGVYNGLVPRMLQTHSTAEVVGRSTGMAGVVILPLAVVEMVSKGSVITESNVALAVMTMLYAGCLSAGVGTALMLRTVRVLGPIRSSGYQFIIPVVAALIGWVVGGSRFTVLDAIGGAIILLGVALVTYADEMPTLRGLVR